MITDKFIIDTFGNNKIHSIASNAIVFKPKNKNDLTAIENKLKQIILDFDLSEENGIIHITKGQSRLLKFPFAITFYTKINFEQ